jgi:GLPGLI family protein
MRKSLVLAGILVSIAAAHIVSAQSSEGVMLYEMKVNLHRRLPPGQDDMKAMVPEFRTTKAQVFFNASESLFKPVIEDEEDETSGSGGVQIKLRQPNDEIYIKPETNAIVAKREFMGKEYLIADTLKVAPWKFGTETKEIQGYLCKQAFYTDASIPDRRMEITAWYTDKLRPMLGPDQFGTLPGTVLAVDINNGERVLVARKIEWRSLKKNELKPPSGGTKMTQKEYRKMVDEQMAKMRANGGVIIRN